MNMERLKDIILKWRRAIVVLAHIVLMTSAYIAAFYVRFEYKIPQEYISTILLTLPGLVIIKTAAFHYFGLFSGMWRYVSMDDLWQILKANVISTSTFILFIVFVFGLKGYPRSIFILDWCLCVGFVSGIRFVSRGIRERVRPQNIRRSIKGLIVGAGEAGILVLQEIKRNLNVDVVGFIDDNPSKIGSRIHGLKVIVIRRRLKGS